MPECHNLIGWTREPISLPHACSSIRLSLCDHLRFTLASHSTSLAAKNKEGGWSRHPFGILLTQLLLCLMVCFPGGTQAHSFELTTVSFRTFPRGTRHPTQTPTVDKIPTTITMTQTRQTKKQTYKKGAAKSAAAKKAAEAKKAEEAAAKKAAEDIAIAEATAAKEEEEDAKLPAKDTPKEPVDEQSEDPPKDPNDGPPQDPDGPGDGDEEENLDDDDHNGDDPSDTLETTEIGF